MVSGAVLMSVGCSRSWVVRFGLAGCVGGAGRGFCFSSGGQQGGLDRDGCGGVGLGSVPRGGLVRVGVGSLDRSGGVWLGAVLRGVLLLYVVSLCGVYERLFDAVAARQAQAAAGFGEGRGAVAAGREVAAEVLCSLGLGDLDSARVVAGAVRAV